MKERYIKSEFVLGKGSTDILRKSRVALFGLGGVGGGAFEALVRAGVGEIDVIDGDFVSESNLNRQLIADSETLHMAKTDAAEKRAKSVNPDVKINKHGFFFSDKTESLIDFSKFDYVIDAVDEVAAKVLIVKKAKEKGTPVISVMGCGNRVDIASFKVTDISKTFEDPLARAVRRALRENGIEKLKTVWSAEKPVKSPEGLGSAPWVPPAAGLAAAGEAVLDIIKGAAGSFR